MGDEDEDEDEEDKGGDGGDGGDGGGGGGGGDDKKQFRKAMDSIMVHRTNRGPAQRNETEVKSPQKTIIAVVGVVGLLLVVGGAGIFLFLKLSAKATTTTAAVTTTTEQDSGNSTNSSETTVHRRAKVHNTTVMFLLRNRDPPVKPLRQQQTKPRSEVDHNMVFAEELDEPEEIDERYVEEPHSLSVVVNDTLMALDLGDDTGGIPGSVK
ncbi:uncharacterized protein LOC135372626 isoform X1 [Ornithodoros turicata]|uniref:uncharacterized protein LOC135372616 isoform X1 n=1 Tax=Ornithodoros turicata TaxID=34597 RepID=UPI003138B504